MKRTKSHNLSLLQQHIIRRLFLSKGSKKNMLKNMALGGPQLSVTQVWRGKVSRSHLLCEHGCWQHWKRAMCLDSVPTSRHGNGIRYLEAVSWTRGQARLAGHTSTDLKKEKCHRESSTRVRGSCQHLEGKDECS